MKQITLISTLAIFTAIVSCTDFEEETSFVGGDISPELTPESSAPATIDEELFDILNLDYPGLNNVRSALESKDTTAAVSALIEYWRERTEVVNPDVNLISTSVTASEMRIADQALEHRFYVRNFYESKTSDGVETYYSFDNDGKINWDFVPTGVTDQEFRYQKHRHQWFEPLAKAYRATGDEAYFHSWVETYKSWLKKYPCPTGTVFPPPGGAENDVDYQWKGLQVAERVMSQINILTYFVYSDNLTQEWFATVLVEFAKAVELMRLNYYPDSNILVTQAQAVGYAGVLMPEFKKAGEWADEGFRKLGEAVKDQFLADGVHYELDPSYHISAIADFMQASEILKLNDKTDLLTDDYNNGLYKATQFVKDIIYPDYTIDNWNDTRSSSYSKSVLLRNLKSYSEMFPEDRELKWIATEGKEGTMPEYTAKAYDKGGYYMLRSGWDPKAPIRTMMILKSCYDPNAMWHNQPDNGTFGLWHNGRNFFPDAGCYAYSGSSRETYLATKNHNTVTLLSKNYESGFRQGVLRKMETLENGTQILVVENQLNADVKHRRSVFQTGSIFTIVDEVFETGAESNPKANLNFHLLSSEESPVGYDESLKDNKQYAAYTTFTDGNNMYMKTFCETSTDFAVSNSSTNISNKLGEVNGSRKGYQFTVRKAKGKAARFITVITPFSGESTEGIDIQAQFTDNEAGSEGTFHENGPSVMVTINGALTYNLTYDLSQTENNENN